jgi:hypothetical protein
MDRSQIDKFRRKLAELAARPETSTSLRRYLDSSRGRDSVDVLNEIDTLAQVVKDLEPERDREP